MRSPSHPRRGTLAEMAKPLAPRSCLYAFPLPPALAQKLPPALAGTLGFFHDRPMLGLVNRELGQEPTLDRETRSRVYDAVEAQIESLGLEDRLYSEEGVGPQKRRVDIRGFVVGVTVETLKATCARLGWTLILPMEPPSAEKAKAKAKKQSAKRVAVQEPTKVIPTIKVPKAIAAKIGKIEALAKKAKVALAKPATPAAIAAIEERLGVQLPIEVRAFYSAHDGGPKAAPAFGDRWLLSLEGMEHYWRMWEEGYEEELDEDVKASRGVRKKWWSPKWLPVTHDAGGNHEMLDLDPTKTGKVGQIVSVYHDDGDRSLEGPDLLTFLLEKLTAATTEA